MESANTSGGTPSPQATTGAPVAPIPVNPMAAIQQEQRRMKFEREQKIAKATLAIEAVLIEHDVNWSEWGEIIVKMNERTNRVVESFSIKFIHDTYDKS